MGLNTILLNALYYVIAPEDSSAKSGNTITILSKRPYSSVIQFFKAIFWILVAIGIPLIFTAIF